MLSGPVGRSQGLWRGDALQRTCLDCAMLREQPLSPQGDALWVISAASSPLLPAVRGSFGESRPLPETSARRHSPLPVAKDTLLGNATRILRTVIFPFNDHVLGMNLCFRLHLNRPLFYLSLSPSLLPFAAPPLKPQQLSSLSLKSLPSPWLALSPQALGEPGEGRVLVVDGGASMRCALLGDQLAAMGANNGWSGVIVNGCIRDSEDIGQMNLGVKALATHPLKSSKRDPGLRDVPVRFAGVEVRPGDYIYADKDGILVSPEPLAL